MSKQPKSYPVVKWLNNKQTIFETNIACPVCKTYERIVHKSAYTGSDCRKCEAKRAGNQAWLADQNGANKKRARPSEARILLSQGWTLISGSIATPSSRKKMTQAAVSARQYAKRKRSQIKSRAKGGTVQRGPRDLGLADFDLLDPSGEPTSAYEARWEGALVCERSGLPFGSGRKKKCLDRIDSSKGYTLNNIQVVRLDYNWAKNEQTDNDVAELAAGVWKKNHPHCACV